MKDNKKCDIALADIRTYKPTALVESEDGEGYVRYGSDNKYPDYIYSIYEQCATLQSIINGSAEYTFGGGIEMQLDSLNEVNEVGDTVEDVVQKLIYDLWIFGGFAFQVQYNALGDIVEIVYLDFRRCRTNSDGSIVYFSNEWNRFSSNYEALPSFDPNNLGGELSQIYYHKGHKTRGVYPKPDYSASLVSAETQIEIQNFHYNSIVNNFMVNGIINFNNADGISDDVKDKVESAINKKFSGTDNASRLMISWNTDKDNAVTFERLSDDQFDKKYEALANSTRDNLFISMRAIPVIFGLSVQTGFNTQEFKDAFALYNKTAIRPKQQIVERVFDKVLGEGSIRLEPFKIDFDE